MMEYDITNIVVGLLIGVGITVGAISLYIWHLMNRFEREIHQRVHEAVGQVKQALLPVIVEQEGDEIFVYSEADRQFLVQGKDARELRERFDQRFPDRIAIMAGGEEQLVERLKAELKALKEQEKSEASHSI